MLSTEKNDNSFYYNYSFSFEGSISHLDKKGKNTQKTPDIQNRRKSLFNINHIENEYKKLKIIIFQKKNEFKKEKKTELKALEGAKNNRSNTFDSNDNSPKRFTSKSQFNNSLNILYRKDAYYKFFKVNFGRYITTKMNILKNKSFPFYSKNNFSSPNYKYTGNPKEKDNFNFLSFTIKELLIYGKDKLKYNRQYNNEKLIIFMEDNESRAEDKNAYKEMMQFLNNTLEEAMMQFYNEEEEFDKIKNDSKAINFDRYYRRETGISLLEKYGFLEAIKKYNVKQYKSFI